VWIENATTSQKYIRSLQANTEDPDLSGKRAVMPTSVLRGLSSGQGNDSFARIGTKLIVGYSSPIHASGRVNDRFCF
jgi:hypothetical protein